MEKASYIKRDIIMIVIICLMLGTCFALLKFYDVKTEQLTVWAQNFYNFILQ